MKRKSLCFSLLFLILFGLFTTQAKSQEVEYNSFEELMYDINSRQIERPVVFLSREIVSIENDEVAFDDEEYVTFVSLLSTCFIVNNEPYKADSILSHALDYMQSHDLSSYSNVLHVGYGSLLMTLENYSSAAQHLELFIDEMRKQNIIDENFAVVLSMLAVCHHNTNQLELAVREIEDAINIIEPQGKEKDGVYQPSIYHESNLMGICQKAGAIFYEYGDMARAIEYTQKAYELSKDDETNVSVYLYTALNLANMKLNDGNYRGALSLLQEIENKPMFDSEKAKIYLAMLQAYYCLDNEDECIKYALLCNNSIIKNTQQFYSSFPGTTIDDIWDSSAMQLKLNMGVLKKFPHNAQAAQMSYDNALFTKRLLYDRMAYLRNISKTNDAIKATLNDINQLRSEWFGGNTTVFENLNLKEKSLIEQLNSLNYSFSSHLHNWQEVSEALGENEYAIEVISYTGWPQNENEEMELRIGALILSHSASAPVFIDICSNDNLHDLLLTALSQQEVGINDLYIKNGDFSLYNLVWAPIQPFIKSAKRIYYSPILGLQLINLGFIPCPDGKYLQDSYDIHIVSSTSVICDNTENSSVINASLYGGIYYSRDDDATATVIRGLLNKITNSDDRGTFGYLAASNREVDEINNLLMQHHYSINLLKGTAANEFSFRELDGASPSILHLSTHGFYLVGFDNYSDYFERLLPYTLSDSDMTKSGILFADANASLNMNNNPVLSDGVLTAEEISWMDLSNTKLVVLSACESAIGNNRKEGWGGLPRAFKMAGVQHIVASLWKVSDEVTADLMILFYKNMMSGMEPHESLIRAQREIALRYPDPYYWAAFIMID